MPDGYMLVHHEFLAVVDTVVLDAQHPFGLEVGSDYECIVSFLFKFPELVGAVVLGPLVYYSSCLFVLILYIKH